MFDRLRLRFTGDKALPLLAVLGLCSGVAAAGVIVLFRLLVEGTQAGFLPDGEVENYEALSPWLRLGLCVAGGLLIGMIIEFVAAPHRSVGVVHVLERLSYHQGHLPLKNLLVQFVTAGVSIISGHSMGREGPGVHLGAATGSLLGQWLTLPNNAIRVLVACGIAGAIAASFNTPLSGVAFAMEVVMMEYTITGFAPVILAAVSATVVSRAVFGPAPAFTVPLLELQSMTELPYMLLAGLLIGVLSASFLHLVQMMADWSRDWRYWHKAGLGGLLMGLMAMVSPEIMGIGYDTVSASLGGHLALGALLGILLFKVLATATAVGLNIPGGLIGPMMFIGAVAGSALGIIGAGIWDGVATSSAGFYALLGLGAMMGATLRAPLAALMAMLEMTGNPNVILPGMLVVITASITVSHLFNKEPIFLMLMRLRGLDYRADPVTQALQRLCVVDAMDRRVAEAPVRPEPEAVRTLLQDKPHWIIIRDEQEPVAALRAADLARWLEEEPHHDQGPDLLQIPGERRELAGIHFQATLRAAQDQMERQGLEVLYVWRTLGPTQKRILGVLTRGDIEKSYR